MYPLLFQDLYKDYIWGGRNMENIGKRLPDGIVAESWEISCHRDGLSVILNGSLAGMTLKEAVSRYPIELLGTKIHARFHDRFPLLVKFIDANARLSVQVHPDDRYASLHENDSGKTEMWYVIEAKKDAHLIYDLCPNTDRVLFRKKLKTNMLLSILQKMPVTRGDVIYIPAGLVHAITEGILLLEIQQNSNATYRVYDYNRTDADGQKRPLHMKKALDVIDFSRTGRRKKYLGLTRAKPDAVKTVLSVCPYFKVERWHINKMATLHTAGERFYTCTCLDGVVDVESNGLSAVLQQGQSCLIPASCGFVQLIGDCVIVLCCVPEKKQCHPDAYTDSKTDRRAVMDAIAGLDDYTLWKDQKIK